MAEPDIWKIIEGDAFYRQFIDKDANFDVKSEAASQGLAVAEQLKKLTEGIALLDRELQSQVLANHDNLLTQATWIEQLETVLATMQSHVQCLLTAVERLRGKIVEPFERIETQTLMLARLQATSDLLRRVARTQLIVKKLNSQMALGAGADVTKASQCIAELDQLGEDVDLTGLEVLDADLRAVRSHRGEIESRARLLVAQGLASYSLPQVSTAMRVFRDLGTLSTAAAQLAETAQAGLALATAQALDVRALTLPASTEQLNRPGRGGPGRAAMPSPGNVSLFRSRLWTALEQIFHTTIFASCKQVHLLQQALATVARDDSPTAAQQKREDEVADNAFVEKYWAGVNDMLAKNLMQAAQGSSFVKQALEGEYPKFLHLYLDLCKRLNGFAADGSSSSQSQPFVVDRQVVETFENAYLSRSVSRLLDPVHQMFSNDEVPSCEEVDALIRTISSELSVSLVDEALSKTVAKNVSKTVRLFCLKCEQLTVTASEATQVIDSCSPGQLTNIGLANILHYLIMQVTRVLSNMSASLSAAASAVIADAAANESVTLAMVNPLLASLADAVEAILLTMHSEDFVADGNANASSAYVKELKEFVARAVSTYLQPFANVQVVRKSSLIVAGRCLELFVRHACLVRPLEQPGRRKLENDFTQMELALSPLVGGGSLSDAGPSHRLLRTLRPLITAEPEALASCPALGAALPFSLALLSMFSRGPPEMPSPHAAANWTVSRLSQWLDDHPRERDRLELISGALQKYQQAVKQKGDAAFHPVYPVMVDMLQRGTEFDRRK